MSSPSVLIVGAGALGLVTGYHLSLAGAEITFLVRPNRMAALQTPQQLYCYDDHRLKTFDRYRAVASVDEAVSSGYDYVLITLDGATCRGQEATAMLSELGNGIRATDACVLVCGVGVYDYICEVMSLTPARVMEGTMGLLSYQTDRVTLPLNPPTDADALAQAAIAYHHMGDNPGFMIANEPEEPVVRFAALYNASGISKCKVVNATVYRMMTASAFPIMAIFDIAGWPDAATMAENRELMSLGARAMAETMALPRHGWRGKLGSLVINRFTLGKLNASLEKACLPVDYSAFNQFHHGGKVREQDIQVMRASAESGRAQGKAMPALHELLRRYQEHLNASA